MDRNYDELAEIIRCLQADRPIRMKPSKDKAPPGSVQELLEILEGDGWGERRAAQAASEEEQIIEVKVECEPPMELAEQEIVQVAGEEIKVEMECEPPMEVDEQEAVQGADEGERSVEVKVEGECEPALEMTAQDVGAIKPEVNNEEEEDEGIGGEMSPASPEMQPVVRLTRWRARQRRFKHTEQQRYQPRVVLERVDTADAESDWSSDEEVDIIDE